MSIQEFTGGQELLEDMNVLKRSFLEVLTPEERMDGLTPEQRLRGLTPEQRRELLALLLAEQGGAKEP